MPFYGVVTKFHKGVHTSWEEVKKLVHKTKAKYRKFETKEEAQRFVEETNILQKAPQVSTIDKFLNIPTIVAYTDGSCKNNAGPKSSRSAGYAVVFPDYPEKSQAFPCVEQDKSNNRAELQAVIKAVELAREIDPTRTYVLHVYTDSRLVENTVNQWLRQWKLRGWKKADGKPVANMDLILQLDSCMQERTIHMTYTPAHTGGSDLHSQLNHIADTMAQKVAMA